MDAVEWPSIYNFVFTHHRDCGRPRLVRSFFFNSRMMANFHSFLERHNMMWFFYAFWGLFGFRTVVCLTCKEICLYTWLSGKLFRVIMLFRNITRMLSGEQGLEATFLYDQSDLDAIENLDLEKLEIYLAGAETEAE